MFSRNKVEEAIEETFEGDLKLRGERPGPSQSTFLLNLEILCRLLDISVHVVEITVTFPLIFVEIGRINGSIESTAFWLITQSNSLLEYTQWELPDRKRS